MVMKGSLTQRREDVGSRVNCEIQSRLFYQWAKGIAAGPGECPFYRWRQRASFGRCLEKGAYAVKMSGHGNVQHSQTCGMNSDGAPTQWKCL